MIWNIIGAIYSKVNTLWNIYNENNLWLHFTHENELVSENTTLSYINRGNDHWLIKFLKFKKIKKKEVIYFPFLLYL